MIQRLPKAKIPYFHSNSVNFYQNVNIILSKRYENFHAPPLLVVLEFYLLLLFKLEILLFKLYQVGCTNMVGFCAPKARTYI